MPPNRRKPNPKHRQVPGWTPQDYTVSCCIEHRTHHGTAATTAAAIFRSRVPTHAFLPSFPFSPQFHLQPLLVSSDRSRRSLFLPPLFLPLAKVESSRGRLDHKNRIAFAQYLIGFAKSPDNFLLHSCAFVLLPPVRSQQCTSKQVSPPTKT